MISSLTTVHGTRIHLCQKRGKKIQARKGVLYRDYPTPAERRDLFTALLEGLVRRTVEGALFPRKVPLDLLRALALRLGDEQNDVQRAGRADAAEEPVRSGRPEEVLEIWVKFADEEGAYPVHGGGERGAHGLGLRREELAVHHPGHGAEPDREAGDEDHQRCLKLRTAG